MRPAIIQGNTGSFTTLPHRIVKQQIYKMRVPSYFVVFTLMTSLIPEDELLIMAESTLKAEIKLYRFEPTTVVCYSNEDSDSDEYET